MFSTILQVAEKDHRQDLQSGAVVCKDRIAGRKQKCSSIRGQNYLTRVSYHIQLAAFLLYVTIPKTPSRILGSAGWGEGGSAMHREGKRGL